MNKITRFVRGLVVACCAVLGLNAGAAEIGDTVTWSNIASSAEFSDNVYRACQYAVMLPEQEGLPVGSTVKIKKVTFAGWDTTYEAWDTSSYKSDFFTIQLNGVKSGNLNGSADKDNVVYPDTVADGIPALTYAFSSDCVMTVGQDYVARTDTSLAARGEGMTLMHDNGNCNAQRGVGVSSVRHVAASGAVGVAVGDGLYPACIIEAEVVSIPVAFEGGDACTISAANAATTSDLASITMNADGVITIDEAPARNFTIISEGSVKLVIDESYTLTPADLAKFTFLTTASELTLENATVADNLVVPSGMTLVSKGTTTIAKATFAPNTALTVETGVLTIETTKKYNASDADRGLQGDITIKAGAELVLKSSDALNYDASANVYVYGTWTNDGTARQSINGNTKIFVYNGGSITGAGDGRGALHFYASNRLVVKGTCTVSAAIQMRDEAHVLTIAQTRDSTATFSGIISGAGSLVKGFATTDEGNSQGNAGNAYCKFSGANTFTGSFTHNASCGTVILLPGVTFSSTTSIACGNGTGFQFGENNEAGRGEIVIHGNVSHTGNQIANYAQTTIEGTLTSNNGISINANSKLTISDDTTITATGSGKFGGAGKIICPANGNAPTYVADTDWTGTVEVLARSYSSGTNRIPLNDYGTANSKIIVKGVAISGTATTWISGGAAVTAELQVDDAMTFNNGSSNQTYVYNKITGTGDITLLAWDDNVKNNVKQTVKVMEDYTGTFNSDFTTTKIEKVVLAETPTEEVKVLALAEGSTAVVVAVYVGEDDITTGDEAACTLTQKEDGWYVAPKGSSELPGEELIDDEEKDAYKEWAAANDVTAETTTAHDVLAIAFHLEANKGETYATVEKAAQAKVEDLLKEIDLAALADPEGGAEAALTELNTELAEKGLVASLEPVELEGASESTKLYKLVIKLIKQN